MRSGICYGSYISVDVAGLVRVPGVALGRLVKRDGNSYSGVLSEASSLPFPLGEDVVA